MRSLHGIELEIALKLIKAADIIDEELKAMGALLSDDSKLGVYRDGILYGHIIPVDDWYEYLPKEFLDD